MACTDCYHLIRYFSGLPSDGPQVLCALHNFGLYLLAYPHDWQPSADWQTAYKATPCQCWYSEAEGIADEEYMAREGY